MNKHSRLLHKVEVVAERPVETPVPAVEPAAAETVPETPVSELDGPEMLGMNIQTSDEEGEGGKLVWVLIAVLVAVAVLVVAAVIYFSRTRLDLDSQGQTVVSTPTAEVSPTGAAVTMSAPTPTGIKMDVSKLKVQVLNGSGVRGKAAKVAETLENLGFVEVATGNASKLGFEEMEVSLKSGLAAVKELVMKELDEYGPYGFKELEESSKFDVVVIVGIKGE